MTVVLKRSNKELGADFQAWADSLNPAQTAFLWNVLDACIESQDSTIVLQLYAAAVNRWQRLTRAARVSGAEEGEHRFFSEEALERDEKERRAAREIVDNSERASGLLLPDGFNGDRKPR